MPAQSSTSLAGRAILALLLTIGFYSLALLIAAGLLFIPYAEIRYANRLHFQLLIGCVLGAGAILWAIIPRRDRFVPPGLLLHPQKQPELFNQIQDIAQRTNQAMPREVYLVPDVNAFVSERGGLLGLGSKRVMGIGLPLLQALSVPQLRAVLAHEFGHYYGGDTKLTGWIYKTRTAIIRTILSFGRDSWIKIPFELYAKLFIRITHTISRRQEFVADELAARVVGSRPLIEGLRLTQGTAPAYQAFWQSDMAPILNAGYRPPLAEGFSRFLGASSIATAVDRIVQETLTSAKTNPYDTHPTLRDRIAAVQSLPAGDEATDQTPALALLQDIPALEAGLFAHLFGNKATTLKSLNWQDVGTAVYLPLWKKNVASYAAALQDVTPYFLPNFIRTDNPLKKQLRLQDRILKDEQTARAANYILAQALTLALHQHGWLLELSPGQEPLLRKGDDTIQPYSLLDQLTAGKLTAEQWQQIWTAAGVAQVYLNKVV